MDNIYYNIKFRKPLSDLMYNLFLKYGIVTGSALLPNVDANDVDIAVWCNPNLTNDLKRYILLDDSNNIEILKQNISLEITDTAQFVFNVLLKSGYSLYIKDNYRDSTFLSCFVYNKDTLYNLMLIDEENVFHEWEYATGRLMEEARSPT